MNLGLIPFLDVPPSYFALWGLPQIFILARLEARQGCAWLGTTVTINPAHHTHAQV